MGYEPVKSVVKALELLQALNRRPFSSVDNLYRDTAIPKPTLVRLLSTLVRRGFVAIGVIPLLIASGAGAVARQSIGMTVFGGMVLASFVGVLFVPVLFVAFESGAQRALRAIRGAHGRESHRQ
jgi:Cu/Ag efflux pump CusA